MNYLGLRVTSSKVFYVIYNSGLKNIETNKIVFLDNKSFPENLNLLRNKIIEIIQLNKIKKVCFKITEKNAMSISLERVYIEGVIQEVLFSNNIDFSMFSLSDISKKIKIKNKDFKILINDIETFNDFIKLDINNILKTNVDIREAIILALSNIK